jgi:hypothetical protein
LNDEASMDHRVRRAVALHAVPFPDKRSADHQENPASYTNPFIESEKKRLNRVVHWNDPDSLAQVCIADLRECSVEYINIVIAERIDIDEWPAKNDGYQCSDSTFLAQWRRHRKRRMVYGTTGGNMLWTVMRPSIGLAECGTLLESHGRASQFQDGSIAVSTAPD